MTRRVALGALMAATAMVSATTVSAEMLDVEKDELTNEAKQLQLRYHFENVFTKIF